MKLFKLVLFIDLWMLYMKKVFALTVIVIVLLAGGYNYINNYIEKSLEAVDSSDSMQMEIEIPSGSSTNSISEILYSNNLIKDAGVFRYQVKKLGKDSMLKAGKFFLSKDMNVDELINALINKANFDNTTNLTLIEGLIIQDTAKSISEQLSLDYDILIGLMNNAEHFRADYKFLSDNTEILDLQGYLLPETYNVYKNLNEEDIVRYLLNQFNKYYESTIVPAMTNSKLSLKEIITLASIVEKEAVKKEERSTIAGVFLKRLDIDMKLQSCATVNYILGEWKPRLSGEDIKIVSPFNTYINKGLPPSPINSPGKASILACLYPENTDYLYFLSKEDGSGTSHFSKTYEEHEAAAKKYLD